MPDDYDYLGDYGRKVDRAARVEIELPQAGPEAPREIPLTPADLDRAFGIGQPSVPSAASVRRVRDTYCK